jgi:hypothetical protein
MLGSMNMAMQQMKTNSYPHPGAFRVGLSVPVGGFAISVKRGIIAFGYRAQQQTPMTERRNANLFEVLIGSRSGEFPRLSGHPPYLRNRVLRAADPNRLFCALQVANTG